MQQIALYYPLIRPPEGWLKSSLLVFEKVSSISPRFTEADDTLEWLRSEELWVPSYADELRDAQSSEDFDTALLEFADTPAFRFTKKSRPNLMECAVLRLGKLNDVIYHTLRELDLAEPDDQGNLLVHEEVQAIILAIAARRVAAMHDDTNSRLVTSTDLPKSVFHAFGARAGSGNHRWFRRQQGESYRCLELLLEGTLPVPDARSSLADVVDFARRHDDEVQQFRRELDLLVARISESEDPLDTLRSCRSEMDLAVRQIRQASQRRIRVSFGSLAILATAVVVGRSLSPDTLHWVFDGFGVTATTAMIGSRLVRGRPNNNPYSYLVRAQDAFGQPH